MSRLVALLVVLAVAAAGCTASGSSAADCERLPGVRSGLCLIPPDARVEAPTAAGPVLGEDDEQTSLEERRGQPVVVNFWGSWCGPCRTEQPELNEVAERFEGQASFLGVDVQESAANGMAYLREFEPPYPSIHDPAGTYAATFDVGTSAMPTTLLIDGDGRIAARIVGATTGTELSVLLTRLLEEG